MTPHLVDVYVGKRLRMKRTFLGLSQEAIGNAIGVTFQQIQKYERGINRMGSSRLYEFAKLMNVPVSYFFEGFEAENVDKEGNYITPGASDNKQAKFETEQLSTRETLELVRAYYKITNSAVRKRYLDLAKSLADQEKE